MVGIVGSRCAREGGEGISDQQSGRRAGKKRRLASTNDVRLQFRWCGGQSDMEGHAEDAR